MSDITLHVEKESRVTTVSNIFIDEYMRDANGEYVKVYLYMLRALGDESIGFSITRLADALDHTQKDISRALLYWQRQGLLKLEYNMDSELTGICLIEPVHKAPAISRTAAPAVAIDPVLDHALEPVLEPAIEAPVIDRSPAVAVPVPQPEVIHQEPVPKVPGFATTAATTVEKHTYSLEEIQLLGRNTDVQEILFITERYMGHPLSSTDVNTVLYWYDGMHFSADLIEYLVEYCVELSHKSIHYMNKVAVSWAEHGITSVDEAKEVSVSYNKLYSTVMKAFGITGRSLTSAEREFLSRWSNLWNMPSELIEEACKRTILKTGKASFQYADSILDNWHKAGAKDITAVEALDAVHTKTRILSKKDERRTPAKPKDRFHNFSSRNYDFSTLENRLLSQQ